MVGLGMGREVEGRGRGSGCQGSGGGAGSLSLYMCVCDYRGEVVVGGKWQICVNAMRRTETPQISRIFFVVSYPCCLVDNRTLGK